MKMQDCFIKHKYFVCRVFNLHICLSSYLIKYDNLGNLDNSSTECDNKEIPCAASAYADKRNPDIGQISLKKLVQRNQGTVKGDKTR